MLPFSPWWLLLWAPAVLFGAYMWLAVGWDLLRDLDASRRIENYRLREDMEVEYLENLWDLPYVGGRR